MYNIAKSIFKSPSPPADIGNIWVDTSNSEKPILKAWIKGEWKAISSGGTSVDSYFAVDDNGDLYVKNNKGLYSYSFVSAKGKDSSGSSGGGGSSLSDVWDSLKENIDAFKNVKINLGHIPDLSISKIIGLQDALDSKLAQSSFSSAQWAAINSTITKEKLQSIEAVTSLFSLDSDGNVYLKDDKGFYTTSFLSTRGKDTSGTSGGSTDLSSVWTSLTTNTDAYKSRLIHIDHIPSLSISKITGLEEALDNNVIETVKLNQSPLSVSNKTVNINAATSLTTPEGLTSGSLTNSGNITLSLTNGYTIPKEERFLSIEEITSLFAKDTNGDVYITGDRGLYSNSFISAHGKDSSGSSSSGTDLQAVWTSLNTNTDAFKNKKIDINHIPELNVSNVKGLADSLDSKVDKETGKGLSSNDYTSADKTKLAGIEAGAEVNRISSIKFNGSTLSISSKSVSINAVTIITVPTGLTASTLSSSGNIAISLSSGYTIPKESRLSDIETSLGGKVDKIDGKGLSTNDFTDAFKTKLTGIESGAEVNKIASIKLNGTALAISSKSVNVNAATSITAPSAMSSSSLSTSGNISLSLKSGYTIPTESRLTAIEKITALFNIDSDGNVYVTGDKGFYSNSFISARGVDSSGTSGGGANLSEVWLSLTSNTDTFKDRKIDTAHIPNLSISKVTGLQDAIDSKADSNHKHSAADITSGTLTLDRIPTVPYSKTSGVQAALVSGTSIKTINGVSLLGSGNIVTPDTTYSSKAAASEGTDLSLVTTGEKYTWNAKQTAISDLSTIRSNAADGATAYGWGDHSKAGYLKSIASLTINGTLYDGTNAVTINTPTYTLSSFGITASAAELNYTKGVTSAIQTQLDAKADASALAAVATSGKYADLTGTPTSLPANGGTSTNAYHLASSATHTLGALSFRVASGLSAGTGTEYCLPSADATTDGNAMILRAAWLSGTYLHDIFMSPNNKEIWHRQVPPSGGTWSKLLDSSNYTQYAPTKTGAGASGTWGINITGASCSLAPNRYPTSGTNNAAPLIWYTGQPAIGTAEGNAYKGSSNDYNLWSYPAGGTSETSTYANIQTLRLSWDKTKYWHDIFASPNGSYLWHRGVINGTAGAWHRIVEETTDTAWGINISGNAATASKLTTARTIWGQSFDGSGNVSGHLTLGTTGYAIMGANEAAGGMVMFDNGRTVLGSIGESTTGPTLIRSITGHVLCASSSAQYTMLDSGNYSSYALPLTGGTLSGNLTAPKITMPGSGGRSMEYNGDSIFFKTYNGGWAADFAVKSTSDTTIGAIAGAYGNVDTLRYYYYGGVYNSPSMVITPGGNVGIGTAAPSNKLHVVGTAYASTGVYSDGFVSARGVDSSSDGRLKTDIKPLGNALQYVLGTKYRSFRWKEDGKRCIGVIAQEELGREHGYLVEKHKDYYSYNYAATTALLGAALQEEDGKVETLKVKIRKLELEIKQLKSKSN